MSAPRDKAATISRRGFLALSAAGTAGVVASGCSPNGLAEFLELAEDVRRAPGGPEQWITSVCGECEGGCSVRVRTVGGRAVQVTGNPAYPLNRNGVCPRGPAALQALYGPDRVRTPLKRVGDRGAGKWEAVSWQAALEMLAQRLQDLRDRHEPHALLCLSGDAPGSMGALIDRFCRAYGTPNDVRKVSPDLEGRRLVGRCAYGRAVPYAYDLERSNYILSFGAPLLEASTSPVQTLRLYGFLRQERRGPKAKIVQVESRGSVTASKADEWVPLRPGTEGALALGIAYVLIREDLYDRSFIERHTFGFEDWEDADGTTHLGFRRLVLQEYDGDAVARITGVPIATILRIAKEFASRRPAVALGESASTNALYGLLAIHALNALVGSIDVPGGVVWPRELPLQAWPDLELDEQARRGLAQPRLDRPSPRAFPLGRHVPAALPQAIADARPYRPEVVFLYHANPVFSSPEPDRFARALEHVPFIVSFSPFLDESSMLADLVLPDHTALERWQDVPAPPTDPYALFGLRQPVVTPVHDTMHTGDVLIRLAHALGGTVARAFPWDEFLDVIRHRVRGLYEARRGTIVEPFTEKPWAALLEERGWWSPSASTSTFEDFWEQLRNKGGWWDPVYDFGEWDRIFQTASGRFEFASSPLREALADSGDGTAPSDTDASADRRGLPHYEPPRFVGSGGQYPFHVNVIRPLALAAGRNCNQPFLYEILAARSHVVWESWVELNPQSAARLGVADGDAVWVESPIGKLRLRARLHPGAMPDVLSIPANLGRTAYGRWATGVGVNPMQITANAFDPLTGLGATAVTRARVSKA